MSSQGAVGGGRRVEVSEGDRKMERTGRDCRRLNCCFYGWRKKQETWK